MADVTHELLVRVTIERDERWRVVAPIDVSDQELLDLLVPGSPAVIGKPQMLDQSEGDRGMVSRSVITAGDLAEIEVPIEDEVAQPEQPPAQQTQGRSPGFVEGYVGEDGVYRVRRVR